MKKFHWLFATIFFIALSVIFHYGVPDRIADLDSFYYMRQAWMLRTEGLSNVVFPWLPLSVITLFSASLWYGFALLLIPFTFIGDLFWGIKLAGVMGTAAALFGFYWALYHHQFRWPLVWPVLLFFSASNVLTQFLMVRPQIISLALAPVLFSLLIRGRWWGVALASFGIAWVHLNFAWVPALLCAVIVTVWLCIDRSQWRELALKTGAVFGGSILGWLLRPNPLGALRLFYIQVIQQVVQKQGGLPLLFGKENLPLTFTGLFRSFGPFLALVSIAGVLLWLSIRRRKQFSVQQRIILWSSAVLGSIFFVLTMAVARRSYNFWVEFGVIFIAAVFTYCIQEGQPRRLVSHPAAAMFSLIFAGMVLYSGSRGITAVANTGYPSTELRESALWLNDHSEAGDVVVNLHWPDFSALFFWNQKNHYVGGLDPIFQYAYSPELYWKFHYLAADQVTKKTCGAIACTASMLEDTYQVFKKDFLAKYVVLQKAEHPAVNQYMEGESTFEKKFENSSEVIYLIK